MVADDVHKTLLHAIEQTAFFVTAIHKNQYG